MQRQQLEGMIADRYEIQQPLVRGGMSIIYLARDIQNDQTVAIKLVHNSASEYCERFRREVQAIAQFEHEHILPALAHGENGSWYYLVTPYIEYGTLHTRLKDGPLSLEEAGDILSQLA
ncbi:MAG: protein kinase, partial [Ktedonobacteraceae bacterium]|nr:protein kinase [Ktedonobacteraceae bacterium]